MRIVLKQLKAHLWKVLYLMGVIGVLAGALVTLLVWRPAAVGGGGELTDPLPVFDSWAALVAATPYRQPQRAPLAAPAVAEDGKVGAAAGSVQPPDTRPIPAGDGARVVVLIDDAGNNLHELRPFLAFPGKLTFAVLPQLPHSQRTAELALAHGHEVILHLPMAAASGLYPGPGTISTQLSATEIRRLLERNFATTPGAAGANNHMGSAVTADARTMDIVMAYLAEQGKFFVDSRTTASSVASDVAARHGVPFMQRDVFLDHDRDPAAIRAALRYGLEIAREQGYAVLIGHSSVPVVVEALAEIYPELQNRGYQLVSAADLLAPPVETAAVDGSSSGW